MRIDDACNLLLRSIEIDLTRVMVESCEELSRWPADWVSAARSLQAEDPIHVRKESLVYYLQFGKKVELLSNFEESLQAEVWGKAFLELRKDLLDQINLRNRLAHPRGSSEDEFQCVYELAQDLERRGCVDSRISEALNDCRDLYRNGVFKESALETTVIHNLPFRDYEDTGLVGRNEQVGEVLRLLKSPSPMNSYIWLTGFGGMGKTAIAREVCHRLVSEVEPHFAVVLWLSFKESELAVQGISKIVNGIKSIVEVVDNLSLRPAESLIDLRSCFRDFEGVSTLIVLDNCETFPGQLDELANSEPPVTVKFLMTSRETGPFGRRVEVGKLSTGDARKFLGRLVKTYPSVELEQIQRDDSKFADLLARVGASPLALKWIALTCEKGWSLQDVLDQKQDNYIQYCVESVYEKLSEAAKDALLLLTLTSRGMSVADITMHTELSPETTLSVIYELSRASLIEREFNQSGSVHCSYQVAELARKYVERFQSESSARSKYLQRIRTYERQAARLKLEDNNRYNKYQVDGSEIEIAVSAELQRILGNASKSGRADLEREARLLCESARNFWEAWRVLAEIVSWEVGREREAVSLMQEAYARCPKERLVSLARMEYFLGQKMDRCGMAEAVTHYANAYQLDPCFSTALGLAQSQVYSSDLEQATATLSAIDPSTLPQRQRFELSRMRLEVYKRSVEPGRNSDPANVSQLCAEALDYWYHSVELRWDAPETKKSAIKEVLVDVLDVYCFTFLRHGVDANVTALWKFVLKYHEAFSTYGFPLWLRTRLNAEHGKKGLLLALSQFASQLEEDVEVRRFLESAGQKPIEEERVQGYVKTVNREIEFAFVQVEMSGRIVDLYFKPWMMERPSEFARLVPKTSIVSGVSKEVEEGRFIVQKVRIEPMSAD